MIARTLLRALLGAATGLAFVRPACAAPSFTQEGGILLSSVSVQSVVPMVGGFRMYLTSGPYHVISATSTDQVSWTYEPGIRLSTTAASFDVSSITAVGVTRSTNAASGWRMYYVGISSTGHYRVLSATSTDGLTWGKEAGVRFSNNSGAGFIGRLAPFDASTSLLRVYYIADKNGANLPANYAVHSASSADGGLNFAVEGALLSGANAFAVSVTTLTGGNTRLYYSAPLSAGATVSQVLSAKGSDGLTFTSESSVRLSTTPSASAIGGLCVLRSTESWRWRMFTDYTVGGTTDPVVSHALTRVPTVETFTPRAAFKGLAGVSYSLTGEVFSPAPTVSFVLGASTTNATTVTRTDDTSLSGTLSTVGASTGRYAVAVVNADGQTGILSDSFTVELPPGQVSIVDNLFRPLKGGKAAITVEVFDPGDVTLRLYTVDGGLVATLYDGPMPAGQTTLTWDGKTPSGNVVASGVYLLHARGPRLDLVERIVVIK